MTTEREHQELRTLLGAFLLGGLDSADRVRFENHLAGCAECTAELGRLAPVPGLLGRLHAQRGESVDPPPVDLLPRLLAGARAERRRLRRRTAIVTLAVAAVTAGVVGVGVSLFPNAEPSGPDTPAATVVALQAVPGQDAAGSAHLTAKPWGTAVELRLEEMPAEGPFRLVVSDGGGVREVAATWGPTPDGVAVVAAASALTPEQVRWVRVVGPVGAVLQSGWVRPALHTGTASSDAGAGTLRDLALSVTDGHGAHP